MLYNNSTAAAAGLNCCPMLYNNSTAAAAGLNRRHMCCAGLLGERECAHLPALHLPAGPGQVQGAGQQEPTCWHGLQTGMCMHPSPDQTGMGMHPSPGVQLTSLHMVFSPRNFFLAFSVSLPSRYFSAVSMTGCPDIMYAMRGLYASLMGI